MLEQSPQAGSASVAEAWAGARSTPRLTHLNSAAAGRTSTAVQAAAAAHARLESEVGGYVAESDASPVIDAGRAVLAQLLQMPEEGVCFTESATAGLTGLLGSWPLPDGASVAVLESEWGPNLAAFAHRGLNVRLLSSHADGRVDLEALERTLRDDPPALVHLTHVASHRALVQPVSEAATLCAAAGVPLWVDAAQALGHVALAEGADAVYATGRKWLSGPRGVGVVAVSREWWDRLRLADDLRPVARQRRLESHEAHIAGRVGLATALQEHLDLGPERIHARLVQVGRSVREALQDVPGWEPVDAIDAPSAITAVRATRGQDVAAAQARLLGEFGVLTTASQIARAPKEMREPTLRVSPHVDCSDEDLQALTAALRAVA